MTSRSLATLETPADVLRKRILPKLDVTQEELAKALGVSRLTVSQLLHGRRGISAEMALRLGKVFGTGPEFWLRLQQKVDLQKAQDKLTRILPSLPVLSIPEEPEDIMSRAKARGMTA